jgi:hypothetical protein
MAPATSKSSAEPPQVGPGASTYSTSSDHLDGHPVLEYRRDRRGMTGVPFRAGYRACQGGATGAPGPARAGRRRTSAADRRAGTPSPLTSSGSSWSRRASSACCRRSSATTRTAGSRCGPTRSRPSSDRFSGLSDRERSILEAHYGLDGEPQSHKEIAERLGISVSRVRQIERRARNKLRRAAQAAGLNR